MDADASHQGQARVNADANFQRLLALLLQFGIEPFHLREQLLAATTAWSAWPTLRRLAPKRAITPSPRNLSIWPPLDSMAFWANVKNRLSSSTTFVGSFARGAACETPDVGEKDGDLLQIAAQAGKVVHDVVADFRTDKLAKSFAHPAVPAPSADAMSLKRSVSWPHSSGRRSVDIHVIIAEFDLLGGGGVGQPPIC